MTSPCSVSRSTPLIVPAGAVRTSESMRAAAARDAAAARVEDDVAFVGGGQRRRELGLRAIRREARGADAAFLVGVGIADERALRASARIEVPPVERVA